MAQLRYFFILIIAGLLVRLSYVLFDSGLHEENSWIMVSFFFVLVLDLIFLVKSKVTEENQSLTDAER
jgi:hypothetical protein